MKKILVVITMAGLAGGCVPDHKTGMQISQAHITPIKPATKVSAAYFTLENYNDKDVALTGATSPCFGAIEIHESTYGKNGTVTMNRLSRVKVKGTHADEFKRDPSSRTIQFKRGGKHLMLFRRSCELKNGDSTDITLQFSSGEARKTRFRIGDVSASTK